MELFKSVLKVMTKYFLLFLFLCSGCAKTESMGSINTINYFGYEKYDFLNNVYRPDSQFAMSDGGSFFSVQKAGCEDKIYKIDTKQTDPASFDINYKLSSIESAPSFNACFSDAADITLEYISEDATKIYYHSILFGDSYRLFIKK